MNTNLSAIYEIATSRAVDKLNEVEFDIKTKWTLVEFIEKLSGAVSKLDTQRSALLQKYGETVGEETTIKKENMDAFVEEFNQLLSIESELPSLSLPLSLLGGLNIKQLKALRPFIDSNS